MTRLLIGDIGGTKTLLRSVEDGAPSLDARYDSNAYETFDALLREFVERLPGPVDAACFAVAGPVLQGRARVMNVAWDIAEDEISAAFPIARVSVINDFHAAALGVPLLGANDLVSLQSGTRDPDAPFAILGAGTGLGQAMVVNEQVVLATEGGHADFAPQDEEQTRLFLQLLPRYGGHVSWDRVASGPGLVNIFTFLGGEECDPAEIAERADRGEGLAVRAFEIFLDVYGAEAGNVALRVLARGGVYLAGGIAAKNIHRFTDGRFMNAFVRKGRLRGLAETIPVDLIAREDVGLMGALECARRLLESR